MSDTPGAVVFDFDDTLLVGESTGQWFRTALRRDPWRKALVLLLAPVWWLLLHTGERNYRRGVSLLLWASTWRWPQARLQASFQKFAADFQRGETRLRWHEPVCAELDAALRRGLRVVVATAAPQELAQAMLRSRWPRLAVFGTALRQYRGGWVAVELCRGAAKLDALARKGVLPPFTAAYTDSVVDLPLLAEARTKVFVGQDARSLQALGRLGVVPDRRL